MNRGLDRIEIWRSGSLGISDDLINFWEKNIKNKMADGEHLKTWPTKKFVAWYLMSRYLDRIQVLCSGFLGISNDLINFWE